MLTSELGNFSSLQEVSMFGHDTRNSSLQKPAQSSLNRIAPSELQIPPSSIETFARLVTASPDGTVIGKVCLVELDGHAFMTIGAPYEAHYLCIDRALADRDFRSKLAIPEKLYRVTGPTDAVVEPGVFITGGSFLYLPSHDLAVAENESKMFGALDRCPNLFGEGRLPSIVVAEKIVALGASLVVPSVVVPPAQDTEDLGALALPPRPRVRIDE